MRQRQQLKRETRLALTLLVLALSSFVGWYATTDPLGGDETSKVAKANVAEAIQARADQGVAGVTKSEAPLVGLNGLQLKQINDRAYWPGVVPVVNAPFITGNGEADARIHALAEARGYRLRVEVAGPLETIDEVQLQPRAAESWRELQTAASQQDIRLELVSAYRSVAEQRELFLERLQAAGASPTAIAAGTQDQLVSSVLSLTSPPGYSKHHSGYTIDIKDQSSTVFKGSRGYNWLVADNYKQAKLHGFVPSYAPEAGQQGPEPEAWEYVWVGREAMVSHR